MLKKIEICVKAGGTEEHTLSSQVPFGQVTLG